jgi:uncharacterized protein (TIGR02246 family)
MPARKPEDCDLLLIEALHAGDLEAAVALYEANASFVLQSGEVVTGRQAIEEVMKQFLALKPTFSVEVNAVQSGDVALLRSQWSLDGVDSDGKQVSLSGKSIEVVRRQADGTWLFVIDDPNGVSRVS